MLRRGCEGSRRRRVDPTERSSDPTERFSDRAEAYATCRPGYPKALVRVLREETGLAPDWTVADVGSGTGLSAEPFLAHGNTVCAVEPNRSMRKAAEARLGDRPGFRSVDGRAEATTLADSSVDLVVVGQAFHWFDVARAREELRRILRPGGPAAVFWNTRRTEGTPFLRAYEALVREFGTDYERVRHDATSGARLAALFGGRWRTRHLWTEQVLDREGLEGRLLSTSYVPGPEHPRHAAMMEALGEIFRAHEEEGRVTLVYDTEIHVGRPAGEGEGG